MDNLVREFRYVVRGLDKDRKFAFVAVFALAPGM